MAFVNIRWRGVLGALAAVIWLGGCGPVPDFSLRGPNYRPLDSEIAAMADPSAPVTGTPLYCRVGKGTAYFPGGWHDFVQKDFILGENARVNIFLARAGGRETMAIQGIFDKDGQKIIFCPFVNGAPGDRIVCASLYALDDDLAMGIKRTFDIPDAIIGGSITCADRVAALRNL